MTELRTHNRTTRKRSPVQIIEREYGKKSVRLHVREKGQIVLVEVISPNGEIFELDPNHVDIAEFRSLLRS